MDYKKKVSEMEASPAAIDIKPSFIEKDGTLYWASKDKSELEFARYKQDCRKRALEMAHAEGVRASITVPHPALIKKADDYYNWLISIPETGAVK